MVQDGMQMDFYRIQFLQMNGGEIRKDERKQKELNLLLGNSFKSNCSSDFL